MPRQRCLNHYGCLEQCWGLGLDHKVLSTGFVFEQFKGITTVSSGC